MYNTNTILLLYNLVTLHGKCARKIPQHPPAYYRCHCIEFRAEAHMCRCSCAHMIRKLISTHTRAHSNDEIWAMAPRVHLASGECAMQWRVVSCTIISTHLRLPAGIVTAVRRSHKGIRCRQGLQIMFRIVVCVRLRVCVLCVNALVQCVSVGVGGKLHQHQLCRTLCRCGCCSPIAQHTDT